MTSAATRPFVSALGASLDEAAPLVREPARFEGASVTGPIAMAGEASEVIELARRRPEDRPELAIELEDLVQVGLTSTAQYNRAGALLTRRAAWCARRSRPCRMKAMAAGQRRLAPRRAP